MSQVITNAFEYYWQSSLAAEQPVVLDEFILADIPNLDITSPIDPATGLPPESQIVHRQNVDQRGRINKNAVAYTIVMDTTVGDFSFNAMYLRNKQNGVIGMIVYKGRETKLKTDQTTGQTGNSLVKSMLMGYDQAAEATLTHVDAGTWQIDYAARLRGQDEDLRQLASQLYGHHTFIGDGFKVVQQDGAHHVTPGVAIVGGLRIELKQPQVIYPGTKPIGVWVDVHRSGSLLSEHQNHFTIITSVADLADHVDSNGYPHYVAKLATVQADSTVIDGRGQGGSGGSGAIPDTFSLWRRSMAEAGYDLIGQFGTQLTIQNAKQVLLSKDGTKVYAWLGTLPKDVDDSDTLISTGGLGPGLWFDVSGVTLNKNLSFPNGIDLVGGVGYLTIEQFGAVRGDNSRSYAPEIQAALNASAQTGKTIRDSGTYYIKGTDVLTVPGPSYPHTFSIDSDNLVFDFSLRDSVASEVSVTFDGVTGALFSGGGHAGPAIVLPSAPYDAQTITATGVSVGDLLLIYSDDTREGDTSPQEIGELNYVQNVTGSVVTLESKLKDNYVTNPKYRVVTPLKNPRIRGLKLRGKGRQATTRGDLGLFILFATTPYIDVEVDAVDQIGVDLIACKGGYMKGYGRAEEKKTANGFVQYLYRYSSGTCDLTVDVDGRLSRHVCNGGSSVNIPGINRNVTVRGRANGTWHAAFSTHNGDELTTFDVSADSCDMGLDLRVGKCTVSSLIANQCRLGLLLRKDVHDVSVGKVIAWGGDAAVSVTTVQHATGRTSMSGIEIDDIDSYDQETAITVNATVDSIPVQIAVGRIKAVRTSPSPGAFAAIRALGSVQLSVGEAKVTDAKGYDVSAEQGSVIYIDTLEIQDHTSAPRILSADGAGSKIIIGRLILRGTTSSPVIQTAGGGVVEIFQTVDMR